MRRPYFGRVTEVMVCTVTVSLSCGHKKLQLHLGLRSHQAVFSQSHPEHRQTQETREFWPLVELRDVLKCVCVCVCC